MRPAIKTLSTTAVVAALVLLATMSVPVRPRPCL